MTNYEKLKEALSGYSFEAAQKVVRAAAPDMTECVVRDHAAGLDPNVVAENVCAVLLEKLAVE